MQDDTVVLQSILMDLFTVRSFKIVHQFCAAGWSAGQMVRIAGKGQAARIAAIEQEQLDARFDLKLEVGTSLPFDRERRKADARELYGILGDVYLERLLDAYEEKDAERILQQRPAFVLARQIIEQQAAQQQSQQQAAVQQQGPGAAGQGPGGAEMMAGGAVIAPPGGLP